MISVDPETRKLIVITDDETGEYVSQVVTNLDRPQPQVLIKVVFLEVTHNDSLDLGFDGQYTGHNKNFGAFSGFFTNFSVITNFSTTGNTTKAFVSGASIVPSNLAMLTNSRI